MIPRAGQKCRHAVRHHLRLLITARSRSLRGDPGNQAFSAITATHGVDRAPERASQALQNDMARRMRMRCRIKAVNGGCIARAALLMAAAYLKGRPVLPFLMCGRGGTGRRATLRSLWAKARGSSSLLDRTRQSIKPTERGRAGGSAQELPRFCGTRGRGRLLLQSETGRCGDLFAQHIAAVSRPNF